MNRRDFLSIGTSALTLPGIASYVDAAQLPAAPKKEKSVVYLYLGGGISHFETFHALPNAIEGYKSVTGSIQTSIPGFNIGGNFEGLAKRAKDITWTLAHSHSNNSHEQAQLWQMSGRPQNTGSQTEPSIGSLATKMMGANNPRTGIPNYVATSRINGDGGAWAGAHYIPFEANSNGLRDLTLNISKDRFAQRMNMIDAVDKSRSFIGQRMWNESKELKAQAAGLLYGDVKKAFEIEHETEAMREMYGKNSIGDKLLLSRRLIQAGVRYVNISYGGFDLHQNIKAGMDRQCPQLDVAICAFIDDLKALGMYEDVLLVVTSEFGRTRLNSGVVAGVAGTAGRDHWGNLVSLAFIGGGSTGNVVGTCDDKAYEPVSGKSGPKDLAYTILSHLQINPYTQVMGGGRPRYLVEENARNLLKT